MPARALGFASGLTISGNVDLTQFVGDMVSNITAANSAISGLQANVTAANVGMKTYVDTQVASAIIAASGYGNSVVAAYLPVNPTITSIQTNASSASANVTAANTSITGLRANITAANLNISSTLSNVTAANSAITALRANITAANLNIISLQSNTTYITSNVGGSVFTNNVYLGQGNLIVGNINAAGNLVMRGTDATTIRFVRSVDTDVFTGEIYGNIDFAGEDSSSGPGGSAAGVRARMSVQSTGSYGQAAMKFYTGDGDIFGGGYTVAPTFMTNSSGYYGYRAGFEVQQVPEFDSTGGSPPYFAPVTNDGSIGSPYLFDITSGAVTKFYGSDGIAEFDIGGTFTHWYAGFAGRDTANILLSGSLSSIGNGIPVVYYDSGQTDLEISVNGIHLVDSTASPRTYKRLRKQWVATVVCSDTFIYTVLDQQLQSPVYNSDATNWAAGAVGAGKAFLQANATPTFTGLYLRLDAPTSAGVNSKTNWQWKVKIRSQSIT